MRVTARARIGVYWDEHNFERPCVILEVNGNRLAVLDARSAEPIPDPPSAIPIQREQVE